MIREFEMSEVVLAPPAEVYAAWLDSAGHSRMTGSPAEVSAVVGGPFTAWGGYISGKNLALEPDRRIVQTWRTTEFQESDPDSRLEVLLEAVERGTRITLSHSNLPEDGEQYIQGWQDFYFTPMKAYFGG
jgi:activator of HSP90 ATPase